MTSKARAELVEKVAKAQYEAEGGTRWPILHEGNKDDYRYQASIAIDIVLEEGARVARDSLENRSCTCAEHAAAAILALKGSATSPESAELDADQSHAIR